VKFPGQLHQEIRSAMYGQIVCVERTRATSRVRRREAPALRHRLYRQVERLNIQSSEVGPLTINGEEVAVQKENRISCEENRVSKDSLCHIIIIASERDSRTEVSGNASRSQIGKSQHKQPRAMRRSVTSRMQASTRPSPRRRSRTEAASLNRRYPIHHSRVASPDFDK